MPTLIPQVIERSTQSSTVGYDIYSRLLKDRIIFVGGYEGEIATDSANVLIAQLLYLDSEEPGKDINLYINSPGGMVTAGLAVYDTMQYVKAPISTICIGMAMSFGAVLLTAGTKGRRYALPGSRIMIHQPLISGGGISGQATDIELIWRIGTHSSGTTTFGFPSDPAASSSPIVLSGGASLFRTLSSVEVISVASFV